MYKDDLPDFLDLVELRGVVLLREVYVVGRIAKCKGKAVGRLAATGVGACYLMGNLDDSYE